MSMLLISMVKEKKKLGTSKDSDQITDGYLGEARRLIDLDENGKNRYAEDSSSLKAEIDNGAMLFPLKPYNIPYEVQGAPKWNVFTDDEMRKNIKIINKVINHAYFAVIAEENFRLMMEEKQ